MNSSVAAAGEARLRTADALLREGRIGQAVGALRALIADQPAFAAPYFQLALALEASGDSVGAEQSLRDCLARDPVSVSAATKLAGLLAKRGQAAEAVDLLIAFASAPNPDLGLLTAHGMALKDLGRLDEAAVTFRRAVRVAPASGAAEHNLAGVLGDAQRFAESEAATRRALAKGLDAPETWLVLGRALRGSRQFDEAERAFHQALRRRPAYPEAHADLAQLIWMRSENLEDARAAMDRALTAHPFDTSLRLALAKLLEYAGDVAAAREVLTDPLARATSDPALLVSAALILINTDPMLALSYAERAVRAAPDSGQAKAALCQVNLAIGRADVATTIAEALCRDHPHDQYPIALAATAWRITGDRRYNLLYDYDRLIRIQTIETPAGWRSLSAYLADLAVRLRALQQLRGHPIGQSLRGGAQTEQSLALSADPVIAAFFTAVDKPIRAYIAGLAGRNDVLASRVSEGFRFSGAWSALLRPEGYHVDHLHPMGWISSACHIVLPNAVERGREGWLKFGEPGLPTIPPLGAERFVKPQTGQLVLFPSYMWHGTVPFGGDEPRLAVAFDVLPTQAASLGSKSI